MIIVIEEYTEMEGYTENNKKKMAKELALSEITLRRYEKPYQLDKRELCKKICLSLGLLQEGDSRDIIVDILLVLLEARKVEKFLPLDKIKEKVIQIRKDNKFELKGIADSNIRRQLKRLRDIMFIEKISNGYRISEFDSLDKIFEEKIERFFLPNIISRIKEYLQELEKEK